jgi:hypothetical protein
MLRGQISPPDGSAAIEISGDDSLVIPVLPDMGIVPLTTGFFVEKDNIPVSIVTIS